MKSIEMRLAYDSALNNICQVNPSFSRGLLRIAYTGDNRNGSHISKESFLKAAPSMFNCPIVCHYYIEEDEIGAHDIEIMKTERGTRLIHLTTPVGVVPESSKYWFETVVEDSGEEKEYLVCEVLLWQRSPAFEKIKEDGIVKHSMEITVNEGALNNGIFVITDFYFTAFCLLGEDVEPCFESSALEIFSMENVKSEFAQMLADLKESFSTVTTSTRNDINTQNPQNTLKGGDTSMDKITLLTEYGLSVESIDFNIEDFTEEELREKFEEIKRRRDADEDETQDEDNGETPEVPEEPEEPDNGEGTDDQSDDNDGSEENFALAEQFKESLLNTLYSETYEDPYWGEISRYCYIDHDTSCSEVYCYDMTDWKMYGFTYEMNGDNVVIDFDSKKRKKFNIVDFDEGSVDNDFKFVSEAVGKKALDALRTEFEAKEKDFMDKLSKLEEFKEKRLKEDRDEELKDVFEKFAKLEGIEAFEDLKTNCDGLSISEIEDKCFEIKGRNDLSFSVSKPNKTTRVPVEKNIPKDLDIPEDEPYKGLFIKYGRKA